MHGLTDAEARVVWSALALPGAPERARLDGSGLPSSTYHATRRRAYEEGWIRDRYVPDPVAFGAPVVSFLLGRPYAEEIVAVGRRWSATEGAAVIWTGTPMSLGVFFHPNRAAARRALERLQTVLPLRDASTVTLDLAAQRVPVYFDAEGAWARFAGVPVSAGYPFGLGYGTMGTPEEDAPRRPLPDRLRPAAQTLLDAPFSEAEAGISKWLGLSGLDRRQRELVDDGYLRPRSFLDPSRIPPFRGRRMDQILLITGEMRDRAEPTALLSELRHSYHASPFLFASEGPRVILGLLGHSGPPAPAAPEAEMPSAPVGTLMRESLARWLCRLDLYREDTAALRVLVDHRYSGLLRPTAGIPAAAGRPARRR